MEDPVAKNKKYKKKTNRESEESPHAGERWDEGGVFSNKKITAWWTGLDIQPKTPIYTNVPGFTYFLQILFLPFKNPNLLSMFNKMSQVKICLRL